MKQWITVYTRSEPACSWCTRVKELLNVYGFDFYEKDISSSEFYKKEFLDRGHKRIPQVYLEGNLIGGYEDTKKYIRDTFFENYHDEKKAIILEELEKIV